MRNQTDHSISLWTDAELAQLVQYHVLGGATMQHNYIQAEGSYNETIATNIKNLTPAFVFIAISEASDVDTLHEFCTL